jgi:hypothetical protein
MACKAQRLQTRLKASCIGSLAVQTLKDGPQNPIGIVTNTFPNSFYARTYNDELLFVTNRPLKSPVTVNIDSASNLQQLVKPQAQISVRGREILVGEDVSIHLEDAAQYVPQLDFSMGSAQLVEIREALPTIALILRIINTKDSVLDQGGLTHGPAAEFVQEGIVPLRSSDEDRFREAASELVGLGSGFTPSGDDMLGGFLAVYNSLAEKIGKQRILLDFDLLEKNTNWISAKLLDYMQRLVLDEQVTRMIQSAASGDELVLAFESLLPRGHTSGIDIATGAVLAFGLAQDIALKTNETEILARRLGFVS